jgi:archaemetzincin
MPLISIVPIYLADRPDLIRHLRECVERTFRAQVSLRTPWFDPETCFDPSRGQYNAGALLRHLLTDGHEAASRILGVISRDLFCPALAYVFGEAQLSGRAAVVSIARLRTEAYGLPRDDRILGERLRKEAIHEIGHTCGLLHCRDTSCVMHPSTYAEQIDVKSAQFCSGCLERLNAV